jgi:IclR family acetate operon transcriptional repressor
VRRLGHAMDNGENEVDGRCLAVPIPQTRIPAALSLSAPASRFPLQDVERFAQALAAAAESITAPGGTAAPGTPQ